ncbi:Myocyte-specific enhancer factor 2D [Mycena venus]|uniref:Myocyte-specific enhancer factor 2D n=1 Tax=Mycena venus TaxID=2733690 RepID=A0A8H7CSD1_9AGAR|nr:Myocyte-specific enhancer factor 2D [Mycena venus]
MGRRKIEIQPITHERNRSVTFLKRKNGLFKKAYELGVLCSVDVAVIIFEERPGHHHKLYQYCSTDIRDIVARHVQYDGERDTRGPADFSGAAKAVDAEGEDDDDADEEEAPPPPPKRTKSKVNKDDMEYRGSSGMAIPSPPISIRNLPGATSNAIPTSSDRHSARSGNGNGMHPPASKKPRLASSRSSDEEASNLTLPPPTSGGYNFPPVQQYRGGGGGGGGGGFGLPSQSGSPFFPPLFDSPPPPSFRAQYDPGMYQQLVRTQQQRATNPANPFGVDWPVHAGGGSSTHSGTGPGPGSSNGTQVVAPQDPNNWLDFLSGPPGLPSGGQGASRSGTSWERGGGGGGGGGGTKRAQSGSRSSSEAGRADDKDG